MNVTQGAYVRVPDAEDLHVVLHVCGDDAWVLPIYDLAHEHEVAVFHVNDLTVDDDPGEARHDAHALLCALVMGARG